MKVSVKAPVFVGPPVLVQVVAAPETVHEIVPTGAGLPNIGADDIIQGGAGDVPYSPYFEDFMAGDNPVGDLSRDFPGLHPTRQRVWVLCGGEGPQRDESLRAAVHAAAALANEQDLLVETFFLDAYDAGVG